MDRFTVFIFSRQFKKINVEYYKSIEILWRISGPADDEYKDGYLVSKGIANSNRDTINLKDKEFDLKGSLDGRITKVNY